MRSYLLAATAVLLAGILWAQSTRPGDAPYAPTKLEWAALELQAKYAQDLGPDKHISMSFTPEYDGVSVHCLLIYDRTVSAAQSKAARELTQMRVADFAKQKGWDWLRVTFKEEAVQY
ncbi:MAG TPA: hypothetical protein VMH04_12605 [Candidatus Solibacter sp.]|nr:hypothetical protein [Candidatus Solibacter sp.]